MPQITELGPGWIVRKPIEIYIQEEDDDVGFVVYDKIHINYGEGKTEQEAVEDYKRSLITFYELVERSAFLRESDRPLFAKLSKFMGRVPDDASL